MIDKEGIRKKIETICAYHRDKAERENLVLEENYEEIWNSISEDLRRLFNHYKAEEVRLGYLLDAKEGVMRIKVNYPDCRLISDVYRIPFVNKRTVNLRSILEEVQQISANDKTKSIIKFLKEQKENKIIDDFSVDVKYDSNYIFLPRIIVTVMKDNRKESIAMGETD